MCESEFEREIAVRVALTSVRVQAAAFAVVRELMLVGRDDMCCIPYYKT